MSRKCSEWYLTEKSKDTQIGLSGVCTSQGIPKLVHSPEKLGEEVFRASRQSEPVPSFQLSENKFVIFKSLSWWLFVTWYKGHDHIS